MQLFLSASFVAIVLLTYLGFARWAKPSTAILLLLAFWLILQSIVAISGFYQNTTALPPRFMLVLAPPAAIIFMVFLSKKGQWFLNGLDVSKLTLIHTIRIPVELILYGLYTQALIPELMTFSGKNLDVLAGLTAPFIYYFGYKKGWLNRRFLITWNVFSFGLLLNIIASAILSAPFPFQQFAFEQPNVALLQFPFVLLPGFVVPVVLFCHLVALRSLILSSQKEKSNKTF